MGGIQAGYLGIVFISEDATNNWSVKIILMQQAVEVGRDAL